MSFLSKLANKFLKMVQ